VAPQEKMSMFRAQLITHGGTRIQKQTQYKHNTKIKQTIPYLVGDDGQELSVEVQVQGYALRLAKRDRACVSGVWMHYDKIQLNSVMVFT